MAPSCTVARSHGRSPRPRCCVLGRSAAALIFAAASSPWGLASAVRVCAVKIQKPLRALAPSLPRSHAPTSTTQVGIAFAPSITCSPFARGCPSPPQPIASLRARLQRHWSPPLRGPSASASSPACSQHRPLLASTSACSRLLHAPSLAAHRSRHAHPRPAR